MESKFTNEDCMEVNKIYCGDSLQMDIPEDIADLILEDMPYNVTQNKWDVEIDLELYWKTRLKILRPNGVIILTAVQPFASKLVLSNEKMFKYDLVWYKALGTGFLNANKMPMRNHEYILAFYNNPPTYHPQMGVGIRKRGMRKHDRNGTNYGKFATQGTSNYFDDEGIRFPQSVIDITNGDRTKESDHPTQKPVKLFEYIIRTYTNENDLVFDGFGGSGTTARACYKSNRNFIVIEKEKDYHDLSLRLQEEFQSQLKLAI
jgi:site-specific DNA-methyltransferase (adenine-specific)